METVLEKAKISRTFLYLHITRWFQADNSETQQVCRLAAAARQAMP